MEHSPRTRVLFNPDQVLIRPSGNGALVPLSETGEKSLTNFVGLPSRVQKNLSPGLRGQVVTELLSRTGHYNLLIDNDEVQAFTPYNGGRNLPVDRVVTIVDKVIPDCDFHRVSILANFSAILEIVGPKQTAVRRGDLVRGGAMVTFSPISSIRPVVQSYVLRLSCTNGQTSKTVLSEYTGGGGEGDDIWQWFRQSVGAAYRSMDGTVERYREMLKDHVPAAHRAGMLEQLLQQAGITGKVAEAVRAQAIQESPRNAYDMLNLITWATSHIIEKPEQRQRAMLASATFTSDSDHASVCPLCHTRSVSN